ncbi:GNAT family N-acetyltransferase [Nocardioides mangrovicus]|uniref:GNAT family N-acetyltransferase n=1 Tax=Nocardioides mangrovicus TaxID=2478913 RepID=UPI00131457C6|nr:GNAT family N-acetyltransferase [Nocardioides mangrovicus]
MTTVPIDPSDSADLRRAVLRNGRDHPPLGDRADAHYVGVHEQDRLVATGNIGPEPPGWRIRGMAVDPAHRGRGLGTQVLTALLAYADDHGGGIVWCHARTGARSLYERAGFVAVGEEWADPDLGPHLRMERPERAREG